MSLQVVVPSIYKFIEAIGFHLWPRCAEWQHRAVCKSLSTHKPKTIAAPNHVIIYTNI